MVVGIDVTLNSSKTKGVFECNHCFKRVVWIILVGTAEKTKSVKLDWIASGEQEAIKDTDNPYYCSKKFVNNVQEAIKDTDEPCCCCKTYVNKFNKSKQYICGLCKTVNYCSKECQKSHWPNHKNLCQSIVKAREN